MSPARRIDDELRRELAAIAESVGCALLDLEFKGNVLRLVLDRERGAVTVDDCATVSRQASALLDVLEFGSSRYVLEVSSPGLDRPLKGPRDYARFVGRLARVTFGEPAGPPPRTVVGRLEAFDPREGGVLTLVVAESRDRLQVPLEWVSKARLEIEL